MPRLSFEDNGNTICLHVFTGTDQKHCPKVKDLQAWGRNTTRVNPTKELLCLTSKLALVLISRIWWRPANQSSDCLAFLGRSPTQVALTELGTLFPWPWDPQDLMRRKTPSRNQDIRLAVQDETETLGLTDETKIYTQGLEIKPLEAFAYEIKMWPISRYSWKYILLSSLRKFCYCFVQANSWGLLNLTRLIQMKLIHRYNYVTKHKFKQGSAQEWGLLFKALQWL